MKYRGPSSPVRISLSTRLLSKTPAFMLAFFIFFGVLVAQNIYAFGTGEPTVFNPNVFGFESSNLKVEGPTGALTERIPIAIPPGRNGLQPDITLEYNSQRTEDSIVGYGWSLSIPYIQRMNKAGSQDLYSADAVFSSSMDGELVQVSTTTVTHRARVDTGASNSYSFSGNTWTVYDKKGTRYTFGMDDASRQYDSATTSARTYTWMLSEIRDTNDNTVVFHYTRDGNQLYPSQINYTGSAAVEGPLAVTFATSTRPDVRESYKTGFKVTTNYRISEIDTLIASSTVGKYLLSYGTGSNGVRSLLTSIQQQGYDENNTLSSLPAMTFAYASSSSMFYTLSSGGDILLNSQVEIPSDVNGNGKNDITGFYYNHNNSTVGADLYIDQSTTVTGITPPDYWGRKSGANLVPEERGTRYLDVNGDGKADVVKGLEDNYNATTTRSLYVNSYATSTDAYSWTASTTYTGTIPLFGYSSTYLTLTSGLFGEINGDGLPDYVMALPGYTGTETYLGNGSTWNATTTTFAPIYNMPTTAPTENASQLIDMNGDGLDDWVYSIGSNTYARLNNGTGWNGSASSQWTIATSTLYQTSVGGSTVYYDRGIRFMDMNGDGLPDFVRSYYMPTHTACTGVAQGEVATVKQVLLNTGNGWATSTAYTLPEYIVYGVVDSSSPCNFTGVFSHREYSNWIGNGQMKQDVMTRSTSAKGAEKSIIYTPSTQLGTNPELPASLLVVTEMGESDGFGNTATTSYQYSGGKVYLANGIRDRKFAGFALSTSTSPDSVAVTYFSQGTGLNTTLGEQTNGYAQINRPFRKDLFDLSNVLKKHTYYRWDSSTIASSTFVGLGRELILDYATDGSTHRDKGTDFLYASTTNDLLRTIEYGEVSGSSDGTFSDIGTDKRTTLFTYTASTSVNMSVPRSKTLSDYSNATTTDERYYYDTLSFGNVTKGNKTTSEKLKSGITYVSSQNAYNSYGLPTSATDPRGKVTTYNYDSKNLYIATSTNPLSQTTQFYYDYSLGKPKQTIDPNGRIFETTYDGVDRPLAEKQPNISNPTSLVNKKTYAYTDTIGSRKIIETNYLDGSTDFTFHTYLDGLNRPIQTRKEAETADQFSVKDFVYNNAGLLKKESLPYFSGGSSKTSASATDALYSRYTYDALKRPLTIANAVGTTTNTYGAWIATTTDALGNARGLAYDAFGRLVQVTLPDTGNVTAYTYDTVGNLSSITDANANVRNFTYDALGRRLTAEDVHAGGDGTYGTWSYVYDASGNLASTTDPKSQQVDYMYDDINRLLTENYTGQGGTEVSYAYDSCTEGIGRLCIATSTDAISSFTYNALGLTASESKNIASTVYLTSYAYDRQSNITGIVYPDNSEVEYSYNTAGLLESVAQKESGDSFLNLISDFDYTPTEKVTFKAFANGIQSTYDYDANTLYRLANIYTSASSTEGGGGMGFGGSFWSNIARAVENFPFALRGKLAFAEELSEIPAILETELNLENPSSSETPEEPVLPEVAELAVPEESILSEPIEEENAPLTPPVVEMFESTSTESMIESETEEVPAVIQEVEGEVLVEDEASPKTEVEKDLPFETIRAAVEGRSASERASIKGQEVAKISSIPRTPRKGYDIEIVSMEPIDGGIQVFVRAWKNCKLLCNSSDPAMQEESLSETDSRRDDDMQIGFGLDGSVDMERFRIFNPPILVEDEKGDIVRNWEDPDSKKLEEHRFREDPKEALLQVIEQNLSIMKNIHTDGKIIPEKRGNTTDTYYPDANPESTSTDGFTDDDNNWNYHRSWAQVHDGDGTQGRQSANATSEYLSVLADKGNDGGLYYHMRRTHILFDTSAIGSGDIVSSATLSIYGVSKSDGQSDSLYVTDTNPASTTEIVATDMDNVTIHGATAYATPITVASFSTSGYNNFSLNSNGLAAVNKIGISKFSLRLGLDFNETSSHDSPPGSADNYLSMYASDQSGTANDPKLVVEHTAAPNSTSTPPTNLLAEGQTNPPNITDPTPEFSAIYNDPDATDSAMNYKIQVATSSSFTSLKWDSGKTALGVPTAQGSRIADISYAGSALASSTTYYWRIKFWDVADAEGEWSTATSTFALASSYTPPPAQTGGIQNISFTYDAVGNITLLTESATSTGLYRSVTYTYDTLYRLTNASTTVASSTPYSRSYTYSKLGNMLSSDLGAYAYAGTGYANSHAVTSIGNGIATTTYGYDNNGNLITSGSNTYAWDYRNHLTSTTVGGIVTSFGYDHTANRMFKSTNFATTTTPNKYYTTTSATTTKNIFTPGGELIATIIGTGANATTTYVHTDWLGGTNVVTNEDSDTVEVEDPYPYGASRISETYGVSKNQRQFAGTERDSEVNLDYMINRFYDPSRGQFISEDPTFWRRQNLENPQSFNSYSYAEGNPINKKDPEGLEAYGVGITIGAEGGLGVFAGFTFSAGLSYVHNPDTDQRWFAAPVSFGSTAGIFGSSVSYPKSDISPTVMGAYAGAGLNVNYSPNAKTPNDIRGVQTSLNFNIPAASVSIQGGQTNSPTISGGLGVKGVGSGSMYSVQTWAPAVSFSTIKTVTSSMVGSLQTAINQLQQKTNTTSNQSKKKP